MFKKIAYFICLLPSLAFGLVGLEVGAKAPDLKLLTAQKKEFALVQEKPVVAVFYRGAWCPYCIKQLQSIQNELYPKIKEKAELAIISVDKPSIAKKIKKKFGLEFAVLSDPKAKSLKAFNIINQLSADLVTKYRSAYGIDIEGDSGETHHMIAHPAVFIIKDGLIKFADVHTDYKKRTENQSIINALKLSINTSK